MFTDQDQNFVRIELDTTQYLGRKPIGDKFFDLLWRHDGIYLPERWDTEDKARLRHPFDKSQRLAFLEEWTASDEWKTFFFTRRRPVPVELAIDMQRHAHAKFNEFSAYIHENYFKDAVQEKEVVEFATEVSLLFRTDYGFIAHKRQERRQSPILTPAERLPGIHWANFFGRPYIEFFGREKLLATPCYEVREINSDLILLLTAESLKATSMFENDDVVTQVKEYLNHNAFAGPNFPQEHCAVPDFDFDDLRRPTITADGSAEEKLSRLRNDLQSKGYVLIEEKDGRLVFRGSDNSVVVVDKNNAEVSVDMTGEFLLQSDASNRKR